MSPRPVAAMPQNLTACKSAFAPAFTSEVCRKAARGGADALAACGRQRSPLRGDRTRGAIAREPPAPDFRLTARASPILAGRVRGARGPGVFRGIVASPSVISSVTSKPLVRSRTPPGHAGIGRGAGAPPADRPRKTPPLLSARRHRRAARHYASFNCPIPCRSLPSPLTSFSAPHNFHGNPHGFRQRFLRDKPRRL